MSEWFLALNDLISSLSMKLSDKDYVQFCDVLDKFKRNPKNPMAILEHLKSLANDPQLAEALTKIAVGYSLPDSLPDDFGKFILKVSELSGKQKLGFTVAEVISYYTEGFVPLDFLHHYLDLLLTDLSPEVQNLIHWASDEMAVRIKVSRMASTDHEYTLFNAIPHELNLQPLFDIPLPLQFLCMINLIIPDTANIVSLVKCLKLYSNRMISISEALEWIGSFDTYIREFFVSMIMKYHPSSLTATNIKSAIDSQLKSRTLQVWAFGTTILDQLASQPSPEAAPDRSLSLSSNTERLGLVPSIMELQSNAFYRQLKGAAEDVQDLRPIEISDHVVAALYGKNRSIPEGNTAAGVVLGRCHKIGAKVFDSHFQYYRNVMEQFDTNSEEWRTHYGYMLDKDHVKQLILFQGANITIPDKKDLDLVYGICEEFITHFKKIRSEKFAELKKVFQGDAPLYMSSNAALFVYYFTAAMHLILCAKEDMDIDEIKRIPDIVFASPAPISEFSRTMLANVDMPLLMMAKMLNRVATDFVFTESPAKVLVTSKEPFFYQISVEDGELRIIAAVNPQMSTRQPAEGLNESTQDPNANQLQNAEDEDGGAPDGDEADIDDSTVPASQPEQ